MEGDYRLAAIKWQKQKNKLNYFFSLSITQTNETGGDSDTHHMSNPTQEEDIPPEETNSNLLWLLIIPALGLCGYFSLCWLYLKKKK